MLYFGRVCLRLLVAVVRVVCCVVVAVCWCVCVVVFCFVLVVGFCFVLLQRVLYVGRLLCLWLLDVVVRVVCYGVFDIRLHPKPCKII